MQAYLLLTYSINRFCHDVALQYRDHTFFHALTFAGSRGSCLNTTLQGRVFKCLLRDLANVNAKEQTCDRYSCI